MKASSSSVLALPAAAAAVHLNNSNDRLCACSRNDIICDYTIYASNNCTEDIIYDCDAHNTG